MNCPCPQCLHETCPPAGAEPPYDELSHEINNNFLSVKIPKRNRKFQSDDAESDSQEPVTVDLDCADVDGKKCRAGCARVNILPGQFPPPKEPEEETFSLRTIRQIMPNDDLKNTLEIELKAPRNYIPLPDPGPPSALIVPRQNIKVKRGKRKCGKK